MKNVFAKRLKSARLLSMMSMDKLVLAMDGLVSKNTIAKYEKGKMMPSSKVLIALAKALDIKSDYFFRPFTVEIENVEFRKRSKLRASKVKAIKQSISDKVERYLELEELLNIPVSFVNPIENIAIKNGDDVELAVNNLLHKWKIGYNALPNVIELLEDKEVKVIEVDEDENFDGLSGFADNKIPIVVVNKNFPIERKRFTALHEVGHLLLNFDPSLEHKEIERLCHRFAGAMLIPRDTFLMELGHFRRNVSLGELIFIKETYGISVQAIMARASALGVISKQHYINFNIRVANKNRKENGWGKYEGKEHSDRFYQLLYRATAEEVISMSKAANLADIKLAQFRTQFIAL